MLSIPGSYVLNPAVDNQRLNQLLSSLPDKFRSNFSWKRHGRAQKNKIAKTLLSLPRCILYFNEVKPCSDGNTSDTGCPANAGT